MRNWTALCRPMGEIFGIVELNADGCGGTSSVDSDDGWGLSVDAGEKGGVVVTHHAAVAEGRPGEFQGG